MSWLLRPVVAILFAMAIFGLVRPFLQDVRSHGGLRKMLSGFQAPTLPSLAAVHDLHDLRDRQRR